MGYTCIDVILSFTRLKWARLPARKRMQRCAMRGGNGLMNTLLATILAVYVLFEYTVTAKPRMIMGSHLGSLAATQAYASFLPRGSLATEFAPGVRIRPAGSSIYKDEFVHCPGTRSSLFFRNCDGACDLNDTHSHEVKYALPARLANTSVYDMIDRALRVAWGPAPPSVDIFMRTGCRGLEETLQLLQSIEMFWPRFLGRVVIVLDHADQMAASRFAPTHPKHAYDIHFEHAMCMSGRIFNQLSYMHADRYSTADYIVTIDSDCMLMMPVTPDLLFVDGKLMFAYSPAFQRGLWQKTTEYFVGKGTYGSTSMVTQPVVFHRSTFSAFREWFRRTKEECYTDAVARFIQEVGNPYQQNFCWMCQLWTFMNLTGTNQLYHTVNVDSDNSDPFPRFALHTTYERHGRSYAGDSLLIALQGLCHAFGPGYLPDCARVGSEYLAKTSFQYAFRKKFASRPNSTHTFAHNYTKRFRDSVKSLE